MAGSLTDIFAAMQNGVVAFGNFKKQLIGSLNNIQSQLAATVTSFNGRTGAVVPVQGDYPTSLIPGTSTNNNATAGNIGEYVSSIVPSTGPIAITSGVATNLTSINISAGDWDVRGNLGVLPSSALQIYIASISSVSAGFGPLEYATVLQSSNPAGFLTAGRMAFPVVTRRFSVAASTTVYVVASLSFGSSASIYGLIDARRPW